MGSTGGVVRQIWARGSGRIASGYSGRPGPWAADKVTTTSDHLC